MFQSKVIVHCTCIACFSPQWGQPIAPGFIYFKVDWKTHFHLSLVPIFTPSYLDRIQHVSVTVEDLLSWRQDQLFDCFYVSLKSQLILIIRSRGEVLKGNPSVGVFHIRGVGKSPIAVKKVWDQIERKKKPLNKKRFTLKKAKSLLHLTLLNRPCCNHPHEKSSISFPSYWPQSGSSKDDIGFFHRMVW